MKAYIANLEAYNAGNPVGDWITVDPGDPDEVERKIATLLEQWDTEEYEVHDWNPEEGEDPLPKDLVEESPDWATTCEYLEVYQKHGTPYAVWYLHMYPSDGDVSETAFLDAYVGEYRNPADYAANLVEQMPEYATLSDLLRYHIDYEGIAHDLRAGGDVTFVEVAYNCTYVFENR